MTMTPTSKERIEAAKRLRGHNGNAYADVADMCDEDLADLIDPICQEVPMESVGRWPFYTGIELHLEKVSYGCSVCGYPWGEIDKWATHGADWLHNSPKYCPNCGCRVVKGVMR